MVNDIAHTASTFEKIQILF